MNQETKTGTVTEANPAEVLKQVDAMRETGALARPRQTTLAATHDDLPARKPETQSSVVEMSGDDIGGLFGALARAQGKFGKIERSLTARIKSKRDGGADYSFDYAPLSEVLEAVRPALSEQEIAISQFPTTSVRGNATMVLVRTLVAHSTGQWMRNDLWVSCVSMDPKDIGSAITYARRYALMAILGIAPDHDDDGASASGRQQQVTPRGAPPKPQAAPKSGPARVKVATIQAGKLQNQPVWKVSTSDGAQVWTDDPMLEQALRRAMNDGAVVALVTETRKGDKSNYSWLVEIEQH